MRLWRVVLLLNLALAVGVLMGWLAWGREVSRLERRLGESQRPVVIGAPQTWEVKGVDRVDPRRRHRGGLHRLHSAVTDRRRFLQIYDRSRIEVPRV